MQNIDLICIGKMNAKYFAEGVAEYQKRLAAFAAFRIIELPEEKIEEKNASDAVVKKALEKEGKAILSNVRKGAAIVAMCIEGRQISSDELAQFLADRANSGAGDVAFVIGSSHGLSDEVKKAAALRFSMGRITMPHQLARLVLTEQIYRACTITAGMKYHKSNLQRETEDGTGSRRPVLGDAGNVNPPVSQKERAVAEMQRPFALQI